MFEWPLTRGYLGELNAIRAQQQRQRGWKLYPFHAPEVECIGKGKASAPYEFGVKASIVTTNARTPVPTPWLWIMISRTAFCSAQAARMLAARRLAGTHPS